jgi:N,N'-diacetyllegionaminate synthase
MTKLIAETAWNHEGDFLFMKDLIVQLSESTSTDVIKMHITLDLDEYMSRDHDAYDTLKKWLFSAEQWEDLIKIVQTSEKELLLLLNDTSAIKFSAQYNPELIELHSVCLNVPILQQSIIDNIDSKAKVIIGVGGCSLQEIDRAVEAFSQRETILMFGFQNYPTKYEDVNLKKIRKIQSLYPNIIFGYADHTAWDEKNNEWITLLVSANGMEYIEKHVTTEYGKKRCDYSAAISIEMFEALSDKVKLLDSIAGDGSISLNSGEQKYSQYGPMKMACFVNRNISCGDALTEKDIYFKRTNIITGLSQIDALSLIGEESGAYISKGDVLRREHLK